MKIRCMGVCKWISSVYVHFFLAGHVLSAKSTCGSERFVTKMRGTHTMTWHTALPLGSLCARSSTGSGHDDAGCVLLSLMLSLIFKWEQCSVYTICIFVVTDTSQF